MDLEDNSKKGKKRVRSARPKDSKQNQPGAKVKKSDRKMDVPAGFHPHTNTKGSKTSKKSNKSKYGDMKRDGSANAHDFSNKAKNNFFNTGTRNVEGYPLPSSVELQDILNKGGVSDINMKKQMLINKIRNNEIDPDKYMKFISAVSQQNEPDDEASEVVKKGSKKVEVPNFGPQVQGQRPVLNFNYNSFIKIGSHPPPVINTVIVNGNNYMPITNQSANIQITSSKKGIREFVTTSKELLGSQKGTFATFHTCGNFALKVPKRTSAKTPNQRH